LLKDVSPLNVDYEDFRVLHEIVPNGRIWMCPRMMIEQLETYGSDGSWPAPEDGFSQKSERIRLIKSEISRAP
jgi:hypothetical protein